MDERALYLKDLERAPDVLAAIINAKQASDHTATLSFRYFLDDPMLAYAALGMAQLENINILVKAPRRRYRRSQQ